LTEDKLIRSNSESISTTDIGAKEAKASNQEDLSQNKNKQTLPEKKKKVAAYLHIANKKVRYFKV
jgi:hypothetical protein